MMKSENYKIFLLNLLGCIPLTNLIKMKSYLFWPLFDDETYFVLDSRDIYTVFWLVK